MALDRQGILNELGSVMNKLQSADCGCMGKLFSNSNRGEGGAMGNPQPSGGCGFGEFGGCRGGCCHGGHRGGFNFCHGSGQHCMSNCNPKKMYADTYNYLNTNLMQPTVNEVYNDLKSITPENTVMNNSMAAKMGLSSQGGNPMQGSNPMQGGDSMLTDGPMQGDNFMSGSSPMQMGNPMFGANYSMGGRDAMQSGNAMYGSNPVQGGNMQEANYMQGGNATHGGLSMEEGNMQKQMMSSPMGNQMQGNFSNDNNMTNQRVQQMMGGMGPNIVDMMKTGGRNANSMNSTPHSQMRGQTSGEMSGQMPGQMIIDAPQSPHGKVGVTPLNVSGGLYNAEGGMMNNLNQQLFTPTTQYVTGTDNNGFISNEQTNMQQSHANANMNQGMRNNNMPQSIADSNIRHDMVNPNMQQVLMNPNTQLDATNPNMVNRMSNSNTQQSMVNYNMQQGLANPNVQNNNMLYSNQGQSGNFNSPGHKMSSASNSNYGQHSQGMKKFNEMFPGVIGGDLGFDPMAIAVQMNPENHRRAAMDQMNKMMSGNKGHLNNALAGVNAAKENFIRENPPLNNQQNSSTLSTNQQAMYGQPESNSTPAIQNQQYGSEVNATAAHSNQQQVFYETNRSSQQPVYTGASVTNQDQQQHQYQQQQMLDPTSTTQQVSEVINQGPIGDVNAQQQVQGYSSEQISEQRQIIQDPIFPADTSRPFNAPLYMRRQKFYQYNTLGQPVQMIPAKAYHSAPETNLPQTLYPQPPSGKLRNDMLGHKVKSTVSKTSLMGNTPVGRNPSQSQLQNIYHKYKGSHSNTQQNIRNPAGQSETYSEGKLGAQRVTMKQALPVPVEKMGGDTAANNRVIQNLPPVKEQLTEQHGDVPAAIKHDTIPTQDTSKAQENYGNTRNGLQDMVYTAYPTSAAWSFHGEGGFRYSSGNRGYRGRA